MKTYLLTACLTLLLTVTAGAQVDSTVQAREMASITHLCDYLGLVPGDMTYRSDYTEPDQFRMKKIADLMANSIDMIAYVDEMALAHVDGQPEILSGILHSDMLGEYQLSRQGAFVPPAEEMVSRANLYFFDQQLNRLLSRADEFIRVIIPGSYQSATVKLSPDEIAFLTNEFKELLVARVEDEFLSPQETEEQEKLEESYAERFVTFGDKFDKDPLVAAGLACLQNLMLDLQPIRSALRSGAISASDLVRHHDTPPGVNMSSYLGRQPGWAVGGPGRDYYEGDYKFILDIGGNDIYELDYDPSNPHPVIIIDLGGDDFYRGQSDFALGSGCLSVGLLLDFGGDDHYDAKSFSLASGFFGFGLLYDVDGHDVYTGDTHVEGAGTFGIGLLIDEGGRDSYDAALYSQGFGFVRGAGLIYDKDGSDSYYAGGKYKDIIRYKDHYLSLSQGFGYGLRPWMSGGIGGIIDRAGNDTYYADIFAQGCAYWWSLGFIHDHDGLDNYQCFQYAQGTATHMALGILIDEFGNDVYFGKGLMQGVGHDYSTGIILDRSGNDTYTAYDLSQGAGSANGAGVLVDLDGDDRYFVKNPGNTQGYGNPRRDFGSIGLFIDLNGDDQYDGNGGNDLYWKTPSKWGGGMDVSPAKPDSTEVQP